MGAPDEYQQLSWSGYGGEKTDNPSYPYELKVSVK